MKKPNLLFVFADQLRRSSVGYTGNSLAHTPHLDRLRAQSVEVCNAVSGHPVCAPYRASLLTGKYTTSTGMVINEIRLGTEHRSFAHVLADGGFETAYIGKWHMYAAELGNHYDARNSFIPPGPDRLGFDGYFAAYNFHHEYYGAPAYYHLNTPEKVYCDGYEPDVQTDMAIAQLERLAGKKQPFALFLSLGTPHDPWSPDNVPGDALEHFRDVTFPIPENYLPDNDPHADAWARLSEMERAELPEWMRVYAAMTANLDGNIGRLLAAVDRMGLAEDTIVVFTSDHGELFGAHGRRAKNIFYEEAVRVPFLVRWPGHVPAGGTTDCCLNTVDIMPSLLTMMKLPVPEEVEGTDMSGDLLGGVCRHAEVEHGCDSVPVSDTRQQTDLDETNATEVDGALMMCTGPTAVFGDGNEWRAFRTRTHTYAIFKSDGEEHLYDNARDPLQMRNLADDPTQVERKRQLRTAMWAKMETLGDRFESNTYYETHWVRDRHIVRTAVDERRDGSR